MIGNAYSHNRKHHHQNRGRVAASSSQVYTVANADQIARRAGGRWHVGYEGIHLGGFRRDAHCAERRDLVE